MSNISRRDFLKTAGVMTLAVAAAGVLAGCDNGNGNGGGEPIPTSPTSATVGDYTISIAKTALLTYTVNAAAGGATNKTYQKALVAVKVKRNSDVSPVLNSAFYCEVQAKNVTETDTSAKVGKGMITKPAAVVKALGTVVAPYTIKAAVDATLIAETKATTNHTGSAVHAWDLGTGAPERGEDEFTVYYEYNVVGNEDTAEFKAPSFDLYVYDANKVSRVKLSATFDAATVVKYTDLGLAE